MVDKKKAVIPSRTLKEVKAFQDRERAHKEQAMRSVIESLEFQFAHKIMKFQQQDFYGPEEKESIEYYVEIEILLLKKKLTEFLAKVK